MKRNIIGITIAIILLLGLITTPVIAQDGTQLVAVGDSPREDRITINAGAGFTLGDIQSISWDYYLENGYPPHVDVFIEVGEETRVLTFEYAYNTDTHYGEAHTTTEAYGALTGLWYSTFSDDTLGPSAVTETSFAWISGTGAPGGPYPPNYAAYPYDDLASIGSGTFVGDTLGNWVAGEVVSTIDADTPVLRAEFEVDSWIRDTTAWVNNIQVNGTGVDITTEILPDLIQISVTPNILDFGQVYRGHSATDTVDIVNTGSVDTLVTVSTTSSFYADNLAVDFTSLASWDVLILYSESHVADLEVTVPSEYPAGIETGTIIFWAEKYIP